MSIDPTGTPRPVEIGAYDVTGDLIARTTVGADGVLAEPLHVPPGGMMVYATGGWPTAIPLGSGSTVTRTVPLHPEPAETAPTAAQSEDVVERHLEFDRDTDLTAVVAWLRDRGLAASVSAASVSAAFGVPGSGMVLFGENGGPVSGAQPPGEFVHLFGSVTYRPRPTDAR